MDEIYPILFMIFSLLGTFLVIGGVIYFIVRLVKSKNNEEKPFNITINLLFKIYLYIISFITLIVAVLGGMLLIKAGASYAFGIPFSYDLYEATDITAEAIKDPDMQYIAPECYEGETMVIGDQKVCFNEDLVKQDLINGGTFFISMLILFGLHQFALSRLEKKSTTGWLKKAYTFLSLILYSVIGVVIIPTAIYQLATHLLYRTDDVTLYSAPGTAVGILIMTLPLWIYFLVKTTKMKDED